MSGISQEYLAALSTPVVTWQKPVVAANGAESLQTVKVWHPAITPEMFRIEFDDLGTQNAKAHIDTPTMHLESVGTADEGTNNAVKDFISSLYMDDGAMQHYADVITWTAEKRQATGPARYNLFATRWHENQLHSGFICYAKDGDLPVGVVNIGGSGIPAIAEFACIMRSTEHRKHYASEAAGLLFTYPKAVRDLGCKLPGADGKPVVAVTATAKIGHGSDKIMQRWGLTQIATNEKYGAQRNVYMDSLADLDRVVQDTKLRNRLTA